MKWVVNNRIIRIAIVLVIGIVTISSLTMTASAYKVGVHWINDFNYPCNANDLTCCDNSANGLYNKLVGIGWEGKYNWGNSNAWEEDFKRTDLGGTNQIYVDSVDIAFVCSHGSYTYDSYYGRSLSSIYLKNPDDCHVLPSDARRAWGDNNLEWIGIQTCSLLRDDSRGYWANTMNGLHLILAGESTMYDTCPGMGYYWANYMVDDGWWDWPRTVKQSWFLAADISQPAGVIVGVIAEEYDNSNDYLWGQGYVSPDPVPDGWYWYWRHTAGCEAPLQVSFDITEMTMYKVVDKKVEKDYIQSLAGSLDKSMEVDDEKIGTDEQSFYVSNEKGKVLQVDKASGIFLYQDLNQLWNTKKRPQKLPGEKEAQEISQEFLIKGNLMPEDAVFTEVITEGPKEIEYTIDQKGNIQEEEISKIEMDQQVVYSRHLKDEKNEFSVVGQGAKMKVYIGDGGKIIGAQGGWRDVEPGETIDIMTRDEALKLLEQYGSKVCIINLPNYDSLEIKDTTLGYFENAMGIDQEYLTPTTIFTVDFIVENELLCSGYIYIPASEKFIPPIAKITSDDRSEDGSTIKEGTEMTLTGSATFGTPPYTYAWYSDIDGYIGEGSSISTSKLSVGSREVESEEFYEVSNTITLEVTDKTGKKGEDTISLLVTSS